MALPTMRMATIAMLALAGCTTPATEAAAPDAEARAYLEALEAQFAAPGVVTTGLGGIARLGDVGVRPIAILEDSRCPHDVQCVWAGRVRLKAAISGVAGDRELILGQPFALPRGGTITLVAVAPEPWHDPPPGVDTGAPPRFGFRRD